MPMKLRKTVWSEPLPMRVSARLSSMMPDELNWLDCVAFSFLASDSCLPCVVEAFAGRVLQTAGGFDQHGRKRGDGLSVEVRAGGGFVNVDVGDGFGAEFVGELLSPLGGTGEADFFAVPAADDEGAARAHAFFRELAEGAREFHHACGAAGGIDAAEDPGVAVIAEHDPFVGHFGAADAAFDHVVGLDAVVHFDLQMDFHAVAAEVILESAGRLANSLGRRGRPCFRAAAWRRARRAAAP